MNRAILLIFLAVLSLLPSFVSAQVCSEGSYLCQGVCRTTGSGGGTVTSGTYSGYFVNNVSSGEPNQNWYVDTTGYIKTNITVAATGQPADQLNLRLLSPSGELKESSSPSPSQQISMCRTSNGVWTSIVEPW